MIFNFNMTTVINLELMKPDRIRLNNFSDYHRGLRWKLRPSHHYVTKFNAWISFWTRNKFRNKTIENFFTTLELRSAKTKTETRIILIMLDDGCFGCWRWSGRTWRRRRNGGLWPTRSLLKVPSTLSQPTSSRRETVNGRVTKKKKIEILLHVQRTL